MATGSARSLRLLSRHRRAARCAILRHWSHVLKHGMYFIM
jgi:hypothetical protein